MVARITHVPLTRLEQTGAAISVAGLVLLGLAALCYAEGRGAPTLGRVWLAASAAGGVARDTPLPGHRRGPACASLPESCSRPVTRTKLPVSGGIENFVFFACLIVSTALERGCSRSSSSGAARSTTAGLSMLLTNVLPIVRTGAVPRVAALGLGRRCPVTAFAAVVAVAALLGARGKAVEPEPHAAT